MGFSVDVPRRAADVELRAVAASLLGASRRSRYRRHQFAVITNEIVQYVGIAILTPIQFYVCRALGTRPRTPMSYVKLCALSVSYCTIIATVVALIIFAVGVIAAKTTAGDRHAYGRSQRDIGNDDRDHRHSSRNPSQFWGMRWRMALGVTLVIAALSWSIVYPCLTTIAERADVGGTLGRLLG